MYRDQSESSKEGQGDERVVKNPSYFCNFNRSLRICMLESTIAIHERSSR